MRHKILFDTGSRSFSTDYDFSGKNTIEFVDGRKNITIGRGTLPVSKDIRNFKASGKFHTKNDITKSFKKAHGFSHGTNWTRKINLHS